MSKFQEEKIKKIKSIITSDFTGGSYAYTPDGKIVKYQDRGTAAFEYSYVIGQMKKLCGQVLTVIDASITNPTQLKAVKDTIRNHFAIEFSELWEASEQKWEEIIEESTKDFTEEDIEKSAVSLEEVVGA